MAGCGGEGSPLPSQPCVSHTHLFSESTGTLKSLGMSPAKLVVGLVLLVTPPPAAAAESLPWAESSAMSISGISDPA